MCNEAWATTISGFGYQVTYWGHLNKGVTVSGGEIGDVIQLLCLVMVVHNEHKCSFSSLSNHLCS